MVLASTRFRLALAVIAVFASVPAAYGNITTFVTPAGSLVDGLPVSATATFSTGADTLTIALTNLESNPTDVVQALSELDFVLSSGQTAGTLESIASVGQDRRHIHLRSYRLYRMDLE